MRRSPGRRRARGARRGSRCGRRRPARPGAIAVLDLLRARTRRFDTVFVLGLEEGSLPRRGRSSPFLDDDRRRELGARLERPDPVSRDRYLFYTACTRATRRLYLVRQAATDDGSPLEASPFWQDAAAAVPARGGRARDPPPAALGAHLADRGGADRARAAARARAALGGRRRAGRARARPRRRERLDAPPPARAARVQARRAPPQPGRAGAARRPHRLRRDRARALRRLLVGVAVRARRRPEDDRRRGRRAAAREDRPPGALRLLLRACRRSSAPSASRPRRSSRRSRFLERCLESALGSGVRLELGDVAGGRAAREPSPRPRALRPRRGGVAARRSCRAASRSASAPTARRPSCSAGSSSATGSSSAARSTGSTSTR